MATYRVIQKKTNNKGSGALYVSFYVARKKIEIPARISVKPSDFDMGKGLVKQSDEFYKDKNLILSDIKAKVNDIFVKYRLKNRDKNTDMSVEQFWSYYHNPDNFTDFFDFCTSCQQLKFQELAEGTQRHHRSCLKILKEFKSPIHFDELTPELFRKFVLYLRNKRGNEEVTIHKTLKSITVYINEAIRKEYLKENPIRQIKLRGCMDTTAVALDESELKTLNDMYRNHVCVDKTHDVLEFFLFMCYTSLHIGDARAIEINQINGDQLIYMRKKLKNIRPKYVYVPLSEPALHIIKRKIGLRKEGLLFDGLMSDAKINLYLKSIAHIAGISKKLSAKVGRHTFATIFLRRTRDLNTLKDILGHSNIRQTLIYSHVIDQDRQEGIKVFNDFAV
ncbi:MAG: site-specific integrase [Tannerellaceae bacterium]|jgi:integrase|nr:site-specific integrase [Tannerellaceae bacterium]